ncbi:UNVERIFIED_CONTAM: Retrovirus-related Pol polyprotein from transposon RE1 [Sesamum angustifolium]|uniref:Retrovirus-related Pol polyprotein from transposon RE1 n=1 Tax=Sesamum angustifolium TaxID=2727405 RepID=A0AAW2L5B0_9LAMI
MATGSGDLTEDGGATKSKVSELLELQSSDHPGNEGAAMFTRAGAYKNDGQNKSDFKKRNFVDKKNLRCDNCNRSGHDRSTCFKIHGIPDWYKDLTEQRKKDGTDGRVFNVQTSDNRAETQAHSTSDATSVSEIVRMELMKFMRGLAPAEQQLETRSDEYAELNPSLPHDESTSLPSPAIPIRRSTRQSHKPPWMSDFVCNHSSSFTDAHMSFVGHLSVLQEPSTFSQAQQHAEWREAMNHELTALENNHTWELTTLPEGKRAIGSKWVYKVKLNPDGTVERYKARQVAKGYNQIEGVDFFDSFSPVAKTITVRIMFSIASACSWPIHQLDISNAFLHGYLDEAVYMTPPEGYEAPSGMVCKFKRSLYGLKQASRQWNLEFTTQLTAYGFRQSVNDHCLFTLSSAHGFLALLVYVDDVLITGTSDTLIQNVKSYLDRLFTIKDLGSVKYFLGLEVAKSSDGLSVSQHKYICDIVTELHLQDAKTCTTPLPSGLKFSANEGALLQELDRYRRLIGKFLYLGFTRPDISFAVQQLSQFLQHPTQQHWDAAIHVVRYLKGSSFLLSFSLHRIHFSLVLSRMSIGRRVLIIGGLSHKLISRKTKKQNTLSRSSAEAEYRVMATTVCELLWITYILKDFQVPLTTPVPFWCDNQAALHITANPVFHERTKHLDIDCHIVRDQYKAGFISPGYIVGHLQPADAFTKILPVAAFTQSRVKLGLVSLPHAPT